VATIYTIDNGMVLVGQNTAGNIQMTYGFRWVVVNGGNEDAASDSVVVAFPPSANQASIRTAVRNALVAWATERGHTISRHILSDLTLVTP
jgi:hypothetical protein